jgi:hypothetical protein
MSRRRERPVPKLPISLESLPPPEGKRTERMMLSWSPSELAMIEKAARERGEQPAVLCRTIVLTAFQNSATRALADQPDLLEKSPAERMKRLLEAFATE